MKNIIELKYSIGDHVWFYESSHKVVRRGKIFQIKSHQWESGQEEKQSVEYHVGYYRENATARATKIFQNDKEIFDSEEEVVNNILKELGYECSINKKG